MPFTLFCHLGESEDAHTFFDEHNAEIEGDGDKWAASYHFPGRGLIKKKQTITFKYDRAWCSPPNWPQQLQGMQNYIGEWEMDDGLREKVNALVQRFRYTIGIVTEPDIKENDDERLQVIHALAECTQGVLFVPGGLLDSQFRAFASAAGEVDEGAEFPEVDVATAPSVEVEEDHAPDPPDAARVAKRLYALTAVAARGLLDMNLLQGNQPAYSLDELLAWVEALDISGELEPGEAQILQTPPGKLGQQDMLNAVWRLEGLVVLTWALGLAEIPHYDEIVATDQLLDQVGFLDSAQAQSKIAEASLLPGVTLDRYNDQVFALHWRLVDFRVNGGTTDFAAVNIGGGPLDVSWAVLADGDLALKDTPISQADPDLIATVASIANERHIASNWLLGHAVSYSNVHADT